MPTPSTCSLPHTRATLALTPPSPQRQRRCASPIARRIRDSPTTFATGSISTGDEPPLWSLRSECVCEIDLSTTEDTEDAEEFPVPSSVPSVSSVVPSLFRNGLHRDRPTANLLA